MLFTVLISGRIAATIKSSFGFYFRNHVAEKRKIFSGEKKFEFGHFSKSTYIYIINVSRTNKALFMVCASEIMLQKILFQR